MIISTQNSNSWLAFLAEQGARFDAQERVTGFGSKASDAGVSLSAVALVPLTYLSAIRVSGDDAADFLQSQVTSDVRQIASGSAQFSGYCTPKGRLLATFLLLATAAGYLLVLPRELASATSDRLRKFVLRSKVKIEQAQESAVLLGLAGSRAGSVARACFGVAPGRVLAVARHAGSIVVGLPGECVMIITDAESARSIWQRLSGSVTPAGAAAWEWRQVRAGIASVSSSTQEAFLPQMLKLEIYGGVSFQKGCYPGQEIVARTQYLGDLKRTLVHGRSDLQIRPGESLVVADRAGEPAGTVVNAAAAPDGRWEFLAVVSRDAVSSELRVQSIAGPKVELEPELFAAQEGRPA
ncbi:MAG: YgfZ/GcvT domain-containing protein [Burkholderiales bacterium]